MRNRDHIPFDPDRPLYGSSESHSDDEWLNNEWLDNDEWLRFKSEMEEHRERNFREMDAQENAIGLDSAREERLRLIREARVDRGPIS